MTPRALVVLLVLSLLMPPAALGQALGGGWLAGPGASGDNTYAGVIDAPRPDSVIGAPGAVQLAGWFLDRTAEGWAGADDVEIYLGTLGNGGTPITQAFFAQSRPDVAATFGRPDWAASGWTAAIPSAALVPGTNLVSVYAHAPAKGWWYKQVALQVSPSATPRRPLAGLGFDISYPQCGGPDPSAPAFAIVGVNGGRAFSTNPCLAHQYVWATTASSPVQPHVGFYMNTGNPGPDLSPRWPPAGTTSPQPCDGSWSTACAYDYGWLAAQDAYARARSVAGDGAALGTWWLDVEAANSWSNDTSTNAADLQGAITALHAAGVGTVGIYALAPIGRPSSVPRAPAPPRTRRSPACPTGAPAPAAAPTHPPGAPAASAAAASSSSNTLPAPSTATPPAAEPVSPAEPRRRAPLLRARPARRPAARRRATRGRSRRRARRSERASADCRANAAALPQPSPARR